LKYHKKKKELKVRVYKLHTYEVRVPSDEGFPGLQ
jgi:hypothetical protein